MEQIKAYFLVSLARLKRLNYRHVLPDIVIITFCLYASLFLRTGFEEAKPFLPLLHRYLFLFVFLRVGTFLMLGVYDIIWRYVSMNDAIRLLKAILLSSVLIVAASYLVDIGHLPRAIFFIDTFLVTLMLGGIRFGRRLLHESSSEKILRQNGRMTLVYGAGNYGRALATRFNTDSHAGFKLVGFVDDDPQKLGRLISGVKVLGTRRTLAAVIRDFQVKELIVAITKPSGDLLREIVKVSRAFGIQPRLVTTGNGATGSRIELFQEIGLSDLLNRPRRDIDVGPIRQLVHNRRVLVTGAGGSIGSELSRQILAFNPSRLLLLDHSEYNLYQIDHELRVSPSDSNRVVPLLRDIKDQEMLRKTFSDYHPEVVFHAAAYKHVHLVESNPYSSIINNVHGTRNLIELCKENQVETFVLISTDKAVNPAGMMGATKRICELMVAEAGLVTGKRYCAVRFGNVLGSSGSLIPLLKQQIENGQPLTITHKDMTRYFMLIPEAVSLVLRAATIARPGDITVLRMGEPLKIIDIAKSLIALMGKAPEEVPVIFTGLRPGEKLFEELYLFGHELQTEDPDILIMPRGDTGVEQPIRFETLDHEIENIVGLARQSKKEAVSSVNSLVNSNYVAPDLDKEEFPAERAGFVDEEGMERYFRDSRTNRPASRELNHLH